MSAKQLYGEVEVKQRGASAQRIAITTPHFRVGTHRPCEILLAPLEGAPIHLECSWRSNGWLVRFTRCGTVPHLGKVPIRDTVLVQSQTVSLGHTELTLRSYPHPAADAIRPVASLENSDRQPPSRHPLGQATAWIGSDEACDIRLSGDGIGPLQIALYWQENTHILVSRRCGRRVKVNDQVPHGERKLHDGDRINIGKQTFTYRLASVPVPHLDDLCLVVQRPTHPFSYPLKAGAPVTIGSGRDNDLSLHFAKGVQTRHARLEWNGHTATLCATSGRPDIHVNGLATATATLSHGDFIRLGDVRLIFRDVRASELRALNRHALHHTRGGVQRVSVGQITRIGRHPANDIVLDNIQVSLRHAELMQKGNRYFVRDLRSGIGTFLNGTRVRTPVEVLKEDVIRIGPYQLIFDGSSLQRVSEEGNARLDAVGLVRRVPGPKTLLSHISLSIYPREFVAVVGGSGAGKTTLMKALSGFVPADEGSVLVNGQNFYAQMQHFRSTIGFVPQDDIIHRELSVRDVLYHAARLRLPRDMTSADLNARIDEVMADLHLTQHQATTVSRLSGGQRKRVSIGVELLTRPRLFFLDEPTSGLDPGLESELMQTFRALADKGHTIILVTHATQSVNLCHKVVFLAEGGHLAFYGAPPDALLHFACDDFMEIYLRLSREKSPAQWAADFESSAYHKLNVRDRLQQTSPPAPQPSAPSKPKSAGSGLHQFFVLTQRYAQILAKDKTNLSIMLGSAVIIAWLLTLLFPADVAHPAKFSDDSLTKAQLMSFFLMMAPIFFGLNNAIREIAKEIPIYRRERSVNLGIVPYVMSKVAVLSLVCLIQVALLEGIVLAHFKYEDLPALPAQMFGVLAASAIASMTMGLFCSALMSNENKAASALPLLIIPQLFLNGRMPDLTNLKRLSYPAISKWSYDSLLCIQKLWLILPENLPKRNEIFNKFTQDGAYDFNSWLATLGGLALCFAVLTCLALVVREKDLAE